MSRLLPSIVVLFCLASSASASAEVLIAAHEAALPPARSQGLGPIDLRAVTRPPEAQLAVLSTRAALEKGLKSPISFRVKFVAYGGRKVDPDATRITYLKTPLVDLTPRLRKYMQASGIDMPNAEIPPGEHALLVELADSSGHVGASLLTIVVEP